jgi:hypothetical protein
MKVSVVFASQETIRAADLGDKEYVLVIAGVDKKTFDDGSTKIVLAFQNAKKKMITNRTNAKRIALLHGDETDTWIGKEIIIRAELVDVKGEPTMAIRVQPPKQAVAQQPAAESAGDGDTPF